MKNQQRLQEAVGIKAVRFGKDQVRFVTHLDFSDGDLEEFGKRIGQMNSKKSS